MNKIVILKIKNNEMNRASLKLTKERVLLK